MLDWWKSLDKDKRWLVLSLVGMWGAQLLYLVSPLDFLPDVIPVLGWIDDLLALASTIAFTVYAVRRIQGDTGFAGLVPEALRPRSVVQAAPVVVPADPHESELAGNGDSMGIDGYRPLSMDELKAL